MLYYGIIALDIAREREREATDAVRRQRMLRELGGEVASATPGRPGPVRALVARAIRGVGNVAHALSDAACGAATRIEGRAA